MQKNEKFILMFLLLHFCFCLNNSENNPPSFFNGVWKQVDITNGINNIIRIDTPYILGTLNSTTPGCSIECPGITYNIDGIWYNDTKFFYYITNDNDTTVIEYRFDENGNALYMHGISSSLTKWYIMFDSLYFVKSVNNFLQMEF